MFKRRIVKHRLRIFGLIVGGGDSPPGLMFFSLQKKYMAPPPEGDKPDLLAVEHREILLDGKFGIKDECRLHRLFDILPEGEEIDNLITGSDWRFCF